MNCPTSNEPLKNLITRASPGNESQFFPAFEGRAGELTPRLPLFQKAFTLVELLVVIAIIGILSAVLLPALVRGKQSAQRVQCAGSLHQLGLAAQMYWDDNSGCCFAYQVAATNNGYLYWFGWLQNGAEGQRAFDVTQGALYPYTEESGVDICPSLNYTSAQFKLKATGAAYGYGYDLALSAGTGTPPVNMHQITTPTDLALLADAAQVNTFEAPASPSNPMLEEFYYVDVNEATAHFRHQSILANVLFCDNHVATEPPVAGSIDQNLPAADVGRLRSQIVTLP